MSFKLALPWFALGLLSACSAPEEVPVEPKHDVVEVQTFVLTPDEWAREIKSYGLISPAEEYEISTDVSATVVEVLFDEGQSVGAGDVLIRLDARQLKLELDQAQAGLEEAKANHAQAKSTHERNESIFEKRVISEQAFRQSEANLKAAEAHLHSAGAALDIARERLADTELKSPVSGVVSDRSIDPGKTASPMSSLGVIQLQNSLRVETYVSQKDINFLRIGMPVRIESPGVPSTIFEGVVGSLASSAEERTGNFEVRISLDNQEGLLRDGMSAKVYFTGLTQSNVLALPRQALVDRNRRQLVFRVIDDVARRVEPVVGVGNAHAVPVLQGLGAGDEIIVSNLRLITDGQKIRRKDG